MSDSRTDTQTADNQHVLIDVEVENDDLLDHHDSQMVSQMSDDEDGEELHPGKAPAKCDGLFSLQRSHFSYFVRIPFFSGI